MIYEPNDQLPLVGGNATTYNVLSEASPSSTTDFKVVTGTSTQTSSPSSGSVDEYFVTSNASVSQYYLTPGTHTSNGDSFSWGGFFQNAKGPNPSYYQALYLGVPPNPYVSVFSSSSAAQSWFSSSDVKTAGEILNSVSYNQ